MPVTAETISLGLPVAIDRIDRELKKLWSEGEGAMTRASLMNLAVYSEEPDSLNRNTQLLARITENHACRAIVIGADPRAKNERMEAWISAHCHFPARFRSPALSLVAIGICRADGRAALVVDRSIDLRQPIVARFQRSNAPGRDCAARSQTTHCAV